VFDAIFTYLMTLISVDIFITHSVNQIQVLWEVTPYQLPLTTSQGVISPEDLNFMITGVGILNLATTLII
jgi:hypothetical protein